MGKYDQQIIYQRKKRLDPKWLAHRNAKEAERARARRKDPSQMFKIAARDAVRHAVQSGKLKRQDCEVCGHKVTHGHHDNYKKPLEVRWLCRLHHDELHNNVASPVK